MSKGSSVLCFLFAVSLACLFLAVPSFADSQARVVRLSDVQGDVLVDRHSGQGFEKAFLNLPLQQDMAIKTGHGGRAAVEFEDLTTLRLVPGTVIHISQLSLRDSGARVSTVHLEEGTAYVNFLGAKSDEFSLTFARETLSLTQPSHLRVEIEDADVTVSVFKGDVQVAGPSGAVEIGKNHSARFDLLAGDSPKLAKEIDSGRYDSWDKEQNQYQERYSASAYSSYSPYAYGTTDLNYYGNFFSLAGYGTVWQPFFVGAGWNPYMDGAWMSNPGFGYGWVSAYPWGWTPYHYGGWVFDPFYGWVWSPGGGGWMGWNTIPVVFGPPAGFVVPRPPLNPGPRVVIVNRGSMQTPGGRSVSHLKISENSAGLGIPRGGLKNLSQLSQTVQQHGSAAVTVHTAPVISSYAWHGAVAASGSRPGMPAVHGSGLSSGVSSGHSSSGHAAPAVHR